MIELKRSSVELADGVRQLITNQEEIFNKGFFSTVQLVLAGSDSQGLRYGTAALRPHATSTPTRFAVLPAARVARERTQPIAYLAPNSRRPRLRKPRW